MKKLSLALVASLGLLSLSTLAQPVKQGVGSCPFTDTFDISGATITWLTADGNIVTQQKSGTEFITACADNNNGNSGNAHLTVTSNNGSCSLLINDGPYDMNPSVISSNCQGRMQFAGMSHDYSTYDYKLNFK